MWFLLLLWSTGSRAWLHGLWDLLESGIEPVSPALSGGFFTTEPPEKHPPIIFKLRKIKKYNFQTLFIHIFIYPFIVV